MSHIEYTAKVHATATAAWAAIADFQNVHRYHPIVERVTQLSEADRGLGVMRVCHFYDGGSVKETIIAWSEGESFQVDLTEGSMPFKESRAMMRVVAFDEQNCCVTLSMDYVTKFGPVGKLMDRFMIRSKMSGMFAKVLNGFEYHLETGELVGPEGAPESDRTGP
jgi:hypothetical protein